MNDEFLEALFTNLGGEQNGWDKKDFFKSMSSDEAYNTKVYDRFINLYGEQEFSQDDFQYGTGLKKKDVEEVQATQEANWAKWANEASSADLVTGGDVYSEGPLKDRPEWEVNLYEQGFDFATGEFESNFLETHKTELDKLVEEKNPLYFQAQGPNNPLENEELMNQLRIETLSSITEDDKKRISLQSEQRFINSHVAASDLLKSTGFNAREFGKKWDEDFKKPVQEAREEWRNGEEATAWRKKWLDTATSSSQDGTYINIPQSTVDSFKTLTQMAAGKGTGYGSYGFLSKNDTYEVYKDGAWVNVGREKPIGADGKIRKAEGDYTIERDKYLEIIQGQKLKEVGQAKREEQINKVRAEMVDELKLDEDQIDAVDDYLYNEFNIKANLSGDKRYNEKNVLWEMGSGFLNSLEDLTVNPIEYWVASLQGEDHGKQVRLKQGLESQAEQSSRMAYQNEGIAASFAAGDWTSGLSQLSVGIAETAPQIGIIAGTSAVGLGGVGIAWTGFTGGTNQWRDSKTEDEYRVNSGQPPLYSTELSRFGSAFVAGGSDAAFAAVGNGIFNQAAKKAIANQTTKGLLWKQSGNTFASRLSSLQGKRHMYELTKGWLRQKGVSMNQEGMEELATSITQDVANHYFSGNQTDISASGVMGRAFESYILGASAGGVFDGLGSVWGRAQSAARGAGDLNGLYYQSQFKAEETSLRNQLENEPLSPSKKADIQQRLEAIDKEREIIKRDRANYYAMVELRYGKEALNNILALDNKIVSANIQFNNSDNETSKAAIKAQYEQLVTERKAITDNVNQLNQEAGLTESFTESEQSMASQALMDDTMSNLEQEARDAALDLQVLQEQFDSRGKVKLTKREKRALNESKKRNKKAKKEWEKIAELKEASERSSDQAVAEPTEANIANAEYDRQQLSSALNLPSSKDPNMSDVTALMGIRRRDADNRSSKDWIKNAETELESSGLSSQQINDILSSDNYASLSAENPMNQGLSDAENADRNARAEAWFNENGLTYHKIVGDYEGGENSFLVEGMTLEQSAEFAKEFDQESVAHKTGLVKANGSIQLFEGDAAINNEADGYFSSIKDADGNVVKYQSSTTESFLDVEGNEITADEYSTAKDTEAGFNEQGDYGEFSFDEDGNLNLPDDHSALSGLTPQQRTDLKNIVSSISGINALSNFKIRLHSSDSFNNSISQDGGGFVDFTNEVINLSPQNILNNMDLEGLDKKKTFTETVLEEVMHSVMSPIYMEMTPVQRARLIKDLEGVTKSKELIDRARAKGKQYINDGIADATSMLSGHLRFKTLEALNEYLNSGVASDKEILILNDLKQEVELIRDDEVITEYLSALVADPSLMAQPGILQKIREFLNKYFGTPLNVELGTDSSALSIIQKFSEAKAGGKIDAKITLDKIKGGRRSKVLFPNQLPSDKSFEVIFFREGTDATTRATSKTFKSKSDFILWARGKTNDGNDLSTYSNFSYNGTPIMVKAMANWSFSKPFETYEQRKRRITSETNLLRRDLVNEADRQRKKGKTQSQLNEEYGPNSNYVGNAYAIIAELAGLEVNTESLYGKRPMDFDGLFEQIESLSLSDLKKVQQKLMPEEFEKNPVTGRSSVPLRVLDAVSKDQEKTEKAKKDLEEGYLSLGFDQSEVDKIMKRKNAFYKYLTLVNHLENNVPQGLSYEERRSYAPQIVNSIENEFDAFYSAAPQLMEKAENFFNDYTENRNIFFEDLKNDLSSGNLRFNKNTGVPGSFKISQETLALMDSYKPVYDVLVALTSPQRQADVNVALAQQIFTESIRNLSINFNGNPRDFDLLNTDFINRLINKTDAALREEGVTGLGGGNLKVVGDLLNNFNNVVKEYINDDGSLDQDRFKNDLAKREESKGVPLEYPKAGTVLSSRSKDGTSIGKAIKVGTFAITLMDPPSDLGNNKWPGNDYLTQDSHVMDFLSKHDGTGGLDFINTPLSFDGNKLRGLVNQSSTGRDIKKLTGLKLLQKACALVNNNQASKELIEEVDKIVNSFSGRDMTSEAKAFRYYRVRELVDQMNSKRGPDKEPLTIKQAGQMIYAMDQVSYIGGGVNGNNVAKLQKYTPYGPIMENLRAEDNDHVLATSSVGRASARIAGEMDNDIDPTELGLRGADKVNSTQEKALEELTVGRNSFGMEQLQLPFNYEDGLTVKAEDSRLYRERTREEGLSVMVKGEDVQLNTQSVNKALETDKTSQRILGKGVQLELGQKVGVRLNLNVLKSTGVPVQTVHDKTASGEALSYSGAVMLRNVNFTVNQNSRQKIVTFQENKNPMASVDGSFVSSDLETMNFDGVKAIFNPFKHNTFVDVSGRPIKSASEVSVIGNNVYLRGDIEYYDFNDPIVAAGKTETEEQRAKRVKRGPKYDQSVKRFQAYSHAVLGVDYNTAEEAAKAYDAMDVSSQVAVNNSEVAKNAEEAINLGRASARIRQTAGRSATIFNSERHDILENPENYISKQNIKENRDRLASMETSELVEIMTDESLGRLSARNDDMGVLSGIELINRAMASGNADAVPGIVAELAKIGTTAGRLLRHFAELKSSTPAGMVMLIQKEVEKQGNTLSEAQTKRLTEISASYMQAHAKVNELMEAAIRGEDVEAELEEAIKKLKKYERDVETLTNALVERNWGTIGTMLVQGNLLTPMSQATNIVANLFNAALLLPRDIIALPIEKALNLFGLESPMKRNFSINAYMYGLRKFGAGFVESLEAVVTGQEKGVTEWRMHRGFAPFRSIMASFGKGEELPLGPDGKASTRQRAKLFIQGTLGIPAEVMFRFLGVGDTPFRRMVEGIELYQAANSMGLKGDKLTQFLKHPTKDQRERAQEEGRKLTFQEQGLASNMGERFIQFLTESAAPIFGWMPGVDGKGFAKFLVRTQVPYVRTPANILYETLTFTSPIVAIPRMFANLKKGDTRGASQNLAKLIVGQSIGYSVELMIREGIISGAIAYGDDEEKNMGYDQFPPSSVNVSALRRLLSGEETTKKADDTFVSYQKLGIFGAIMGARVKATDPNDKTLGDDPFIANRMVRDAFGVTAFSTMAHMMDQSFLQGVSSFTELLSAGDSDDFERKFERWANSTFSAVSATVLPNSLSALYRQNREFLPDTRADKNMSLEKRLMTKFKYTLQDRTFGLGDVPIRRNWKGEKIRQQPEGSIPGGYYLFDVFKSRRGESDPVSNEIWRLYEATEDLSTICGTPYFATTRKIKPPILKTKKELKALKAIGKEYSFLKDQEFMLERTRFSIEDINSLMETAGKQRYLEAQNFIGSLEYQEMSDTERVEKLNKISEGYNGLKEFEKDGDGNTIFKPHTIQVLDIMQKIYDDERR